MEFRLTCILLVYVLPVTTLPMTLYNMARFDPTTITSQLVNSFPISGVVTCMCQCYNNSLCITGNYFAMNQTCQLFSAYLSQGQLRVINNVPATVFSFPNRTTITNSVSQPSIIQWLFDGNLNDVYDRYNGYYMRSNKDPSENSNPLWISPGYAGYGSAIYLSSNMYAVVDQYLDLTSISFTISAWIWIPLSFSASQPDCFALFAHCESIVTDKCFYVGIDQGYLRLGFFNDDVIGSTSLNSNLWYHVAYIYDRSTSSQKVYLNGILDKSRTPNGSYQGNTSQITIGAIPSMSLDCRNGYIDKLTFVSRVKSDSELLDEATLVAYYPFDGSYLDVGSNNISSITTVSTSFDSGGRFNQALLINAIDFSYFQTTGFYYLGQSNYPFSFSLWIYPFTNRGTILQVSSSNDWCLPMIGFDKNEYLTVQTMSSNGLSITTAHEIPSNSWTHVGITYSLTNGIRLFVNGILFSYNSKITTYNYVASGNMDTITLGTAIQSANCALDNSQIITSQFQGKIDELKIFSRELSSTEVSQLAQNDELISDPLVEPMVA